MFKLGSLNNYYLPIIYNNCNIELFTMFNDDGTSRINYSPAKATANPLTNNHILTNPKLP